jgi:hypothetical protein
MSTPYETLAYLFEDMEKEMESIFSVDPCLNNHLDAIKRNDATIDEQIRQEELARAAVTQADVRLAEIRAMEKDAIRQRKEAIGEVNGCKGRALYFKRLTLGRISAVQKRKKELMLIEGKKRLNMIGRDIRHNRGRRAGIGLDIVNISDGPKPMTARPQETQQEI